MFMTRLVSWVHKGGGLLVLSLSTSFCFSADLYTSDTTSAPDWQSHFQKGAFETSVGAGLMFSPFGPTKNRPTVQVAQAHADFGYMLSDVRGKSFYRGNFEVLGELYGAGIFKGAGDYFAGPIFSLRYNFLPWASAWTPYFQMGAGFLFTDYDRSIVGQAFQFDLESAVGVRRFITRNVSLNLEYRMQHISNANTGPHNLGINSHGPSLSASWFF
jgi:hypothetical protein